MRDELSSAMSRFILAGAGVFLLLVSMAEAGRTTGTSSGRLPPTAQTNPATATAGAATAAAQSPYEPRRTWEASLFGRRRGWAAKAQAGSRGEAIPVAETLRGGGGRGASRPRPAAGGRGGVRQRPGRGGGGGGRQVRWADDEDDDSYDDDESDGYDYSDDDVDDLSEEEFSYGGRPAGEGGARASGRGGSRKGPAAAAAAAAAARANNDDDYLSDDEGLYDSDDLDGEGGDGSYDDYYDEDDDDNDSFGVDSFDDGYGNGNARAGSGRRPPPPPGRRGEGGQRRGGGPSRGGRGRGRRGPPPPARMERLKAKLADAQVGLKTKMTGVTHKGAKVMRELKGSISSDLEKTLIKATRPDNDPAKRKHVNLLLQAAEHAFPVYMNPKDGGQAAWKEGPYWMTLHKLWRRMAERDYRTASKAVYVLHRLARGTTAESWGYFRSTLQEMRRDEDKGTKSRYFSRRVISNVDDDGRPFSEWLDAYAEFVLLRLQSFSPELGELAAIDAETPHEKASRSLEKAAKLIKAALACEIGPDLDNDVTCDGLKLVIEDLCEVWSLFQQKLEIRLQQRFTGSGFSSGELRRTLSFLEFYLEHLSAAQGLVQESHRLLALYSHAVPKGLGDDLATEMLQEQVAWIQEELTEKAKASVGKSVTSGSDASPSPSPAATKKRRIGGAPTATARKPQAAAKAASASAATPAAAAAPTAASKPPAAPGPKRVASKKPAAGGVGGGGAEGSVTAKRKASGGGGAAGSKKKVSGGSGEKKAEGAAPRSGSSKTATAAATAKTNRDKKKGSSSSSSARREL
ncbi:unnamed protein product [Ectocarpus sp. 12 AP-2014]